MAEHRGGWPGPRKGPLTIRLHPDLQRRTKAFARRTGQTVTSVVTKALSEYLDRHEEER